MSLNQFRVRHFRLVGEPLLYAVSCFASLGVFLFGYDQGVMSGIITGPYFKAYFNQPSHFQLGNMVAILEIGAFVTSIAAGRVGDILGRRKTLFTGACTFVAGGALQTFSTSYGMLVMGRLVSGAGVGLLSLNNSAHIPERDITSKSCTKDEYICWSSAFIQSQRGKLACIEFTGNVSGYAFSVWVDYFCSFINSDISWRLPLALQCVIGAILAAGSLLIPESPRWLLDTDKDEAGMKVIVDLHGGDPHNHNAREEFREIKEKIVLERQSPDRSYAMMWRRYRQRVLLAMSSQAFAQLNGINVISYYAPLVFQQAGWLGRDAILMTGINAIIYVLSTVPTWYLVDMWGRRIILISGAMIMTVALVAIGWWMYVDLPRTPQAVVVCVIIYNAAFGYSWGPIPWLYPPEIMPLTVRAKGVSLSTATNWFFNFLVGEGTPVLQDVLEWRLYPMHALFCLCSAILVFFLYPETKGVPLEEMDTVFGEEPLSGDESERASLISGEPHRNSAVPNNDDDGKVTWWDWVRGKGTHFGQYRTL